jgi:TonB family protein
MKAPGTGVASAVIMRHSILGCAIIGVAAATVVCAGRAQAADEVAGAVEGSVVERGSGAPLAPVTVMLFPASGPAITRNTDARGAFRFGPLAPGEYTVTALFGTANARIDGLPVKAGEVTPLTFRFDVRPEVVRIREKAPHITVPEGIDSTIPRIPPYSDEAILSNVWGVAWLLLKIDESGAVADVKVLKGPGHDLEPLAIATAKKFRFRPAHDESGTPVATQLIYVMEWPSYWSLQMGQVMIPPCQGEGPLNLDSANITYRDCEPPPGLAHLKLKSPRLSDYPRWTYVTWATLHTRR